MAQNASSLFDSQLKQDVLIINITSVYAPTLCSTAESKDQFYEELDVAISNIPKTEQLYILGDVNARVGADHDSWLTCLWHHGMGGGELTKMEKNQQFIESIRTALSGIETESAEEN